MFVNKICRLDKKIPIKWYRLKSDKTVTKSVFLEHWPTLPFVSKVQRTCVNHCINKIIIVYLS